MTGRRKIVGIVVTQYHAIKEQSHDTRQSQGFGYRVAKIAKTEQQRSLKFGIVAQRRVFVHIRCH